MPGAGEGEGFGSGRVGFMDEFGTGNRPLKNVTGFFLVARSLV